MSRFALPIIILITLFGLLITSTGLADANTGQNHHHKPTPTSTKVRTKTPTPTKTKTATPTKASTPKPTVTSVTTSTPSASSVFTPGLSFQWQLQGTIDTSVNAQVYDVDGFDTPASTVAALRAQGKIVVCYISAGTYEDWRSDASSFPSSVLGSSNGWPGEKWLDIRHLDTLKPIMAARFDMCKSKGFDAVEPDNIDGYTNSTGFPLTANDQIAFNTMLANLAHERGLAIALKNDLDQVKQLVSVFDFAINEQCNQYNECAALVPFIQANKAVFEVEYGSCPSKKTAGFTVINKRLALDAWVQFC